MTAKALGLSAPGHQGPVARLGQAWLVQPVLNRWPWRWGDRARSLPREAYRALLKRVLRYRGRTIVIIAGLCIFTFIEQDAAVRRTLTSTEGRRQYMWFHLLYPRGTKLDQVDSAVRVVEQKLSGHGDIKRFWVWYNDDEAQFSVQLKPPEERAGGISLQEFTDQLFEFIGPVPGAILSLQGKNEPAAQGQLQLGSEGRLQLRGPDLPVLNAMAERVSQSLTAISDITHAEPEQNQNNPEILVKVDRERAALFDVNAQTVARYIASTRRSGTLSQIKLESGERRTDVVFELGGEARETISDIRALPIFSSTAGSVPLEEVATFRQQFAEEGYWRQNRQQSQNVIFQVRPGANAGGITPQAEKLARSVPNPGGVSIEAGGTEMQRREREEEAAWMMQLGIVLVFMVMAFIFEAYWVPLVILSSIPLVTIGVTWILLLAKQPMDDLSKFGMLLLVGLVVNAPIVMLDRAQTLRHQFGYRRTRAVFQACDQRLRPVCMTVLTTILGLLPMAIFRGEGNEWASLALTIIGGLISSTLLTLIVIPCLYLAVEDVLQFIRPPFVLAARLVGWAIGRLSDFLLWMVEGLPVWLWRARLWRLWLWPVWAWRATRWAARQAWAGLKAAWRAFRVTFRRIRIFMQWAVAVTGRMFRPPRKADSAPRLQEINRELPGALGVLGQRREMPPGAPPVVIQSLRVIYPVRRWSHLFHVFPSRHFAIGCRPADGVEALSDINLTIQPGLFGLLGPNGAGKTTLMRCLTGLLPPTRGTVWLYGLPLRDHPETLTPLVGYLPQYHGHYDHLTLREYLEYFLLMRMQSQGGRLERREIDRAVAAASDEVHLLEVLDERVGTFSGGMRQRAGLARVLLGAPPILIVDEPTAGLDPVERVKVRLLMAQLAQTRTVIFSTHLVEDLELSCQAVGILRQGKLLFSGPPEELLGGLRGRLWEVPVEQESDKAPQGSGIEAALFRVVRPEGLRWRCVAPVAPVPGAIACDPRLEDAFVALLRR